MKIYIASSWKNQHAVEMLTALLRERGHTVISFVENNYGENPNTSTAELEKTKFNFEEWVWSEKGEKSFQYDTNGAKNADLTIYISPSGKDAAAEVGIAWANGKQILGIYSKGEDFGLMRRLIFKWCTNYKELLVEVELWEEHLVRNKSLK